jgi:hypothetical protein
MQSIVRSRDDGFIVTGSLGVYKINEDGDKVWEKTHGDYEIYSDWIWRNWIITSMEGGYVVNGLPCTYKINENGDKIWENKHIKNRGFDSSWYEAAGMTWTDDYGFILVNHVGGDLHFWKINSEGDKVWDRFNGNDKMSVAVAMSEDNGCMVAGWTQSFGAGTRDAYLSKIDQDGNRMWERSFGGPGWDSAQCITQTLDDGYVAAGYSTSFGEGNWDVYVFRIDDEGRTIWENTYGTPEKDMAIDITPSGDGGFVILGTTKSKEYNEVYAYLLKVNAWGEKVWDKNLINTGSSITATNDGGFIIAGQSLLRIDSNGQIVWEENYQGDCISGFGDRFLVTSGYSTTFMIDGAGNKIWEKNYNNLNPVDDPNSPYSKDFGGEVVFSCCDGSYILLHNSYENLFLWRIDEEGETIWATQLLNLSSETPWWQQGELWFNRVTMARGKDGTFTLASQTMPNIWLIHEDHFIAKFRDPDLAGIECPETYSLEVILLMSLYLIWRRTRRTRTPA